MEKYENAVLEVVELKNDVIRTSDGGSAPCGWDGVWDACINKS